MNERIKELAFQSLFINKRVSDDSYFIDDPKLMAKLDKFAELVVRDCMTQIQEIREIKAGHAGPVYTQGVDDGLFVSIRTIEEHFGVEE
jgi:hypothetical protein